MRMCPSCEYDLSGLPEPCVCPECGREIEAGLYSLRVWEGIGGPSWLLIVGGSCFSLLLLGVSYFTMVRQGLQVLQLFWLAIAFALLWIVFGEVRRLRTKLVRTTTSTLHWSPLGVGIASHGSLRWVDWSRVQRIRHGRAFWRRDWIIQVEDGKYWFEPNRAVLGVALPCSRRTAARVRNTLRRHLHAWREANLQARE